MDKIGRKISKNIENPVLSVEILDDDVLVLNVFRGGKNVASHISCSEYSYIKKLGNPDAFVKELGLREDYSEYIKWSFKCEDLRKKIQLLEKILGIPIWIDYRMIFDSPSEYDNIQRDLDYVENYIKENKALRKIKNATKAKLLIEFDGKLHPRYRDYGC